MLNDKENRLRTGMEYNGSRPATCGSLRKNAVYRRQRQSMPLGCPQGTGIVKFGNSVLPFDVRIPDDLKNGLL